MLLRPPLIMRLSTSTIGVMLIVCGGVIARESAQWWLPVACLVATVGVAFILRTVRWGIVLREHDLVVRGLFWSRTIPHRAIVEVPHDTSEGTGIIWRTDAGDRRWTPVTCLWVTSESIVPLRPAQQRNVDALRTWWKRGPGRSSPR